MERDFSYEYFEEHIVSLEMKISYLEDFVNKLQDVSIDHTKQIDLLIAKNKSLSEKVRQLSDAADEITNNKPPHY